ncbi:MAG TPA: ADP-ribosylglycohydrolase family protein [Rhodothermales bacterium]|nr:ADP-ribosylglycohydrolase family protein [Rhodothermales bacterium]
MPNPQSAIPLRGPSARNPQSQDRIRGALLGLALGDALGAPVDGLSHQNVRTYYKGVKGFTDDEKRRDVHAGQWTAHTQRARALTRMLTTVAPAADHGWSEAVEAAFPEGLAGVVLLRPGTGRGPRAAVAACAAPLGVWAWARGATDDELTTVAHAALWGYAADTAALAAAIGQARAVALALDADPETVDGRAFLEAVGASVAWADDDYGMSTAVSTRIAGLAPHLDETPLDLQDRAGGTGDAADEAFPFAVAMAAREPALAEATLLSAVNVGGAASAVGAMAGALMGAFNGWSAFPAEWRDGLEDVAVLLAEADALAAALGV